MKRLILTLALAALLAAPPAQAGITVSERYVGGNQVLVEGRTLAHVPGGTVSFLAPVDALSLTVRVVDRQSAHAAFSLCVDTGTRPGVCAGNDPGDILLGPSVDAVTVQAPIKEGTLVHVTVHAFYARSDLTVAYATSGIAHVTFE